MLIVDWSFVFVNAIVREKYHSAEDKIYSSSEKRPSALDWFQNSQQTSQSSEAGLGTAFRPHHALPSFTRSCPVPPAPTYIENLHLSQAFRGSSFSSQPALDSALLDFCNDAEVSVSSASSSSYQSSSGRKDNNIARSGPAVFKVPYRNPRPVAKVSGQENAVNVANVQCQKAPVNVGIQADRPASLNAVDIFTHNDQQGLQKPAVSEDKRSSVVKTPQTQQVFSRVHDSATATPFPHVNVIRSTSSAHHHVGDTPLALSGSMIKIH